MNKVKIFLVLIIGLFISGCSIGNDNIQTSGISIGGGSVQSSGSGVDLSFGANSIEPQKSYEFPIVMNFVNNQNHEVQLEVRPTGFDKGFVSGGGIDSDFSITISSATQSGPGLLTHLIEGVSLDGFSGDYNFDPTFKYCYEAKTEFSSQICVPDRLGECEISTGGSAANGPLGVRIDRIYPIGEDNIILEFTLSNSADGNVVNECFQEDLKMDFGNRYEITTVSVGSTDISNGCEPVSSNDFVVNNDESKFKCQFDRTSDDQYSSQVVVELDYLYQQEEQNKITIRDLDVN